MITRIIFAFILFAALAYYFNIDVRAVVDKSGVPTWLSEHGIAPKHDATTTPEAATTTP